MDDTEVENKSKLRTTSFLALLRRINEQLDNVKADQVIIKQEQIIINNKITHASKVFQNLSELEAWLENPENVKELYAGMSVYFIDPNISDL